jgi:hypothetical protein
MLGWKEWNFQPRMDVDEHGWKRRFFAGDEEE